MNTLYQDFDTEVDTKNFSVPIHINFVARKGYINKQNKCRLYLHATSEGKRKRLGLNVYVDPLKFDRKKQRLKGRDEESSQTNLVIDNIAARCTGIITASQLSGEFLSLEKFIEEFISGVPRSFFWSFCEHYLEQSKGTLEPGTVRRYAAVIAKGRQYKPRLRFHEITRNELDKFINYLATVKKNQRTTINANMAVIKKFLNAALGYGIKLKIEPEHIKIGSMNGNRIDLSQSELKRYYSLYQSPDVLADSRKLVLAYFLFGCFTGLRVSEIKALDRSNFYQDYFEYHDFKNKKARRQKLNKTTKKILESEPDLFVKKLTGEHINRELKELTRLLQIKKKVTMHVARHTFATNFIRMGGDVVTLQHLLGHSKLETTMIYVHIVEAEMQGKVLILDQLILNDNF